MIVQLTPSPELKALFDRFHADAKALDIALEANTVSMDASTVVAGQVLEVEKLILAEMQKQEASAPSQPGPFGIRVVSQV